MMLTEHPRGWLWSDWGLLRVRNKVRCIQTLSSTLPTMINKTRRRADLEEKRCRRCRKEIGDSKHSNTMGFQEQMKDSNHPINILDNKEKTVDTISQLNNHSC